MAPRRYMVLVTADATVSTYVDVEANNPREAETLALTEATYNPSAFNWTVDDGNPVEPYLCDPGHCAEEQ